MTTHQIQNHPHQQRSPRRHRPTNPKLPNKLATPAHIENLNHNQMVGAKELAKRTLTNLYNKRPTWLANAHRTLDEAVFAAYGWREAPDELSDAEIVARLLRLNLEREPA